MLQTVNRLVVVLAFGIVLFLSRWPLAPPRIVTFDAANFAFALKDFNPAEHKPQPPGYPLYVGLTRLIHYWIEDVSAVFVLAGLTGSLIAVVGLVRLGKDMSGWPAGIAAGALLAFHPSFWTAGLLNPVRVFIAAASACVGLFVWRAWRRESPFAPMLAAWAALGISFAFRPPIVFLLGPLCFWAGVRRRNSAVEWLLSAGVLMLPVLLAVGISAWAAGGFGAYTALLSSYADEQFENTSILLGAAAVPALKMAGRALIWSFVPVFCWLWLVPFSDVAAWWKKIRELAVFFLLWCGPSLVFVTIVHSAEPGHVLPVVVPLCLAGGLVAGFAGKRFSASSWWRLFAIAAPPGISAAMFFFPPTNVMRVSSMTAVRIQADRVIPTLAMLDDAARRSRVTVIASLMSSVPWRVLAWYHPEVPMVVLAPQSPTSRVTYRVFRNGHTESEGSGPVPAPGCGTQMWLVPGSSGAPESTRLVQKGPCPGN